jgi:hypothetical protein
MEMYTHENSIMSPLNTESGAGEEREEVCEYNGGGELIQDTLYTCMELSQ